MATGCPYPLDVVRIVDGPRSLEGLFHRHYAALRTKGEWFKWCSTMVEIEPAALVDNRAPEPQINIRADQGDIDVWQQAARLSGLSLSAWLRLTALKAARREIANASPRKAAA